MGTELRQHFHFDPTTTDASKEFIRFSPLSIAGFCSGLEHNQAEGSVWGSQLPRRPDVQVGEDNGGDGEPAKRLATIRDVYPEEIASNN